MAASGALHVVLVFLVSELAQLLESPVKALLVSEEWQVFFSLSRSPKPKCLARLSGPSRQKLDSQGL